ncbi:RICIN domain-containing protein [Streptomyces tibetensis]|uniref:RICIN domain-containing protein n=1 Tax=Streptomyces tibetensis TaxID=2382123 RepID=UPI003405E329
MTITGSSHVLGVKSQSLANDAAIIRWSSPGGTNQRFALAPLGDGYTRIANQASGKGVVIRWASRDAGAKAVQYPYEVNANTNDEWLAEGAGNGRVRLLNRHSGLYLTAGSAQGDRLEPRLYQASGQFTQKWNER